MALGRTLREIVEPRFLVDINVERLGRWLRALGYDTRSLPGEDDDELVRTALQEERVLLTRDTLLVRRKLVTRGHLQAMLIRDDDYRLQLRQVVQDLGLEPTYAFTRCMECNTPLRPVPPGEVEGRVPPYVFQTQNGFKECPNCGKLYWKGTHWARMWEALARVIHTA